MAEKDAILDQVTLARGNYLSALEQLVREKIPGVIDPVAAGCSVGEVCHGGTFKNPLDMVVNPADVVRKA